MRIVNGIICLLAVAIFEGNVAQGVCWQNPETNSDPGSVDLPSWRFIRGSNFDGISAERELLETWPEKGPPLVWHRSLGQGYSSFTGQGNRIFTQYQSLTGQFVVCLDAQTGKTIWEHRHSWPFDPAGLYPGPQSTPTLDQDKVYFTSPKGLLGCLRQDDGQVVWQIDLMEGFDAEPVEFGYSCTPVLVDGLILLPVGGNNSSMVALKASDGSLVWRSGSEPISHASALPIQFRDKRWVVGYFKNCVQLFDFSDGKLLATLELSEGYDEHSCWPIYREPYLWISAPFRAGSMWLEVSDQPPGLSVARVSDLMSNDVCSSVLFGDSLYGFDIFDVQSKVHRPSRGHFRCLDFATGTERWSNGSIKERRSLEENSIATGTQSIGHAAVLVADGKLIMLSDTGELIMAWADPQSYREIGRSRLLGGEICWTQPMLMDGFLYARDHSRVVCAFVGKPDSTKLDTEPLVGADELVIPRYRDWSAILLSVEPEYAMTAPSADWLVRWFWVSFGLGWLAGPLLGLVGASLVWRFAKVEFGFAYYWAWTMSAFWMGVLGTTFLSRWLDSFLFTWQLSLAIAFQWLLLMAKVRRNEVVAHPWLSRIMLVLFLGLVIGYFVVCRRLSLAFEWCFLLGFPAAIPFLYLNRRLESPNLVARLASTWMLTGLAFSAFYWTGAGVMLWRYAF